MATLEPPNQLDSSACPGLTGTEASARSSTTHIQIEEGVASAPAVEQPPTSLHTSQGLPQATPSAEDPLGLGAPEPKSPSLRDQPPPPPPEPSVPQTPQVFLTFLIISGRRRTMSFDPDTTIGRVKELVWNAWPTEWEDERPMAPSYLRILYLGKMLQDDDTLTKLKFVPHMPLSTPAPTPTIVHLSIRPFAAPGEGDLKKKRNRGRSGDSAAPSALSEGAEERGAGGCCGCVIC